MKETSYRVRRVLDGKFANQTRFFGRTNWGKGQSFVQLKAAKRNFKDLLYKRDTNFPWKDGEVPEKYKERQAKNWGLLQLVKFTVDTSKNLAKEEVIYEA
ncbi:MAG: hypothetical protein ACW99F_17955 [Candidatus Hodarchaeales archaeon]|jgi:hypothetical protein